MQWGAEGVRQALNKVADVAHCVCGVAIEVSDHWLRNWIAPDMMARASAYLAEENGATSV